MKKSYNTIVHPSILALGLFAGYAVAQPSTSTTPPAGKPAVEVGEGQINYKVYEILDKDLTSVTFTTGKHQLTAAEKSSLESFVKTTKAEAQLDKYIIAAWSDKDYPTTGEKLTKADETLARKRADAVKSALKSAGAKSTDTYLMTERPNWLQKVFSTGAAEVKGSAETPALANKVVESLGTRLRDKGGPGMVVVVAKFKREVAH